MRTTRPAVGTGAYLLIGVLIIAGAPLLPLRAQQIALLTLGAVAAGAVVAGIRRYRPTRGWPWLLLLAALAVAQGYTVAATVRGPSTADAFPRLDDWLYLLTYPLLIIALAGMPTPRGRASRAIQVLDAAIITCTAGVLSWALIVNDFVDTQRMSVPAQVVVLAYPVFDLFLAATVIRIVVMGGWRNPAHRLLFAGVIAMTAADTCYFLTMTPSGPGPVSSLAIAGWLLAYVCLSGAALHPAMAHAAAAPGGRRAEGQFGERVVGRGAIARYAALVAVGPAVTVVDLIGQDGQIGPVDVLLPLTLTAVIGILLVVRSGQLADVAQRRAADLNSRTAQLEMALDSQAALQEQLAHRALHDALTGLPNRVLLRERLDHAVARTGRHALLMLDLDGFKDVNDTLGHPVGDELLQVAASRLSRVLARGDTLARLGGDEFAVLLEDLDATDAHSVALRVLGALREPFAVAGHRLHITASVGMLELVGGDRAADVLRDADLALYAAKDAGKNRVVVYHDELRADRLRHTRMVERLRHALDADELDLHYQPVVALRTGRVVGAEALLRWRDADGSATTPDQFIPIAESSGLIIPIGAWVLRRACAQARDWYDEHGVRIAVNVSVEQLRDDTFPAQVAEALASGGLPARALTVEVTESMLVDPTNGDAQRAVAHLTELRSWGVQVALDDFGTGYSSLAYLRDLPVDQLKIDRAFVPTADTPQCGQLTRAIVDLGASLGLVTVAEGVETAEQAAHLTALSCDLAQGYYFAGPMPATDFTAVLTNPAVLTGPSRTHAGPLIRQGAGHPLSPAA